ncbi:MAG: DUF4160 domain-containing protein [Planctomycetes bacterium]|nr:DUF4160 domain-containing protein [Planctomycetota bacterium]MBI3845445.1 DUF4160 domain-containing protein [Planctomycetota bacterium]
MPTVLRRGPYRLHFFSSDDDEPPHVHVDRDRRSAKFWLEPVTLAHNVRFGPVERRRIWRLVIIHEREIMEA